MDAPHLRSNASGSGPLPAAPPPTRCDPTCLTKKPGDADPAPAAGRILGGGGLLGFQKPSMRVGRVAHTRESGHGGFSPEGSLPRGEDGGKGGFRQTPSLRGLKKKHGEQLKLFCFFLYLKCPQKIILSCSYLGGRVLGLYRQWAPEPITFWHIFEGCRLQHGPQPKFTGGDSLPSWSSVSRGRPQAHTCTCRSHLLTSYAHQRLTAKKRSKVSARGE